MPRGTERAGLECIDGPEILERTLAKRPTQIPGRVPGKKSRRPRRTLEDIGPQTIKLRDIPYSALSSRVRRTYTQ